MIAALLRRQEVRWRSRQLYEMLISPPPNHSACGGSHFKTVSQCLNQCNSSAIRAQKPSGSRSASARNSSSSRIELMCAFSENSGGAAKMRSSCNTDSMFVVDVDMTLRLVLLCFDSRLAGRLSELYVEWPPCLSQKRAARQ